MLFQRVRNRCAFTLVELLVVIAIIGVLVGMLLPAVQAAREAVRRAQCFNNLRQIGLALHSYESAHRKFPSGWRSEDRSGEPGWSWSASILPFMEQSPIYQQIDLNIPIEAPRHQVARVHIIPSLLCPSDIGTSVFWIAKGDGHHSHATHSVGLLDEDETPHNVDSGEKLFQVSKSNYSGVFGTLEIEAQPYAADGVFYGNSRVRLADITDGLSNTMIVGERSSRWGSTIWHGVIPEANEAEARIVGSADHTPNHPGGHFEDFTSYHSVGAHFIMGDCSTRLIADTISLKVYQAMATRASGEIVNDQD